MEELKQLVASAQTGDPAAFGELVKRRWNMAWATDYGWLGKWELAEAAAQDALVETYMRLGTLREPAAFVHWFRLLLYKRCDRLARGKRMPTVPLEGYLDRLSAVVDPGLLLEQGELQAFVQDAVLRPPQEEQVPIVLFYLGGHSQEAISAQLQESVGAVKKRLWRARQRLRERMLGKVGEFLPGYPLSAQRSLMDAPRPFLVSSALSGEDNQLRFYTMSPEE